MSEAPDPLTHGLTVPEVAHRYRIGEDKVRALIRRGELRAINTASQRCRRPRWVITPDALAAFEAGRQARTETPKTRRRSRLPRNMKDFFPD